MNYFFVIVFSLLLIITTHNTIEIFILKKKHKKILNMIQNGDINLCDLTQLEENDFINWCDKFLEYIGIYTSKLSSPFMNIFLCKNKNEILLIFISKTLSKALISQAVGMMTEHTTNKTIIISTDICHENILNYIKTFDKTINIIDGKKLIEEVKKLRKKEIEYLYLVEDT